MKPASLTSAVLLLVIGLTSPGCRSVNEDPFPPGTQLAVGAPPGANTRLGSASAPDPAGLSAARFSLGRSQFEPGDFIVIHEMYASSPLLAPGDRVVLRGEYQLSSADEASLEMHVTGGRSHTLPSQRAKIRRGTGQFELAGEIPYQGDLHVSFYSARGGQSFGGVYIFPR